MSKKSAKKRQPVKPVVAKEPARTANNFGYEEMLSELLWKPMPFVNW